MTTIVGIVAKDGVIIASDKRATEGFVVASRDAQKIIPINDTIALAGAGLVADLQILAKVVSAELKLRELRSGRKATAKEAAHLTAAILYSKRFYFSPYLIYLIIAGKDLDRFTLYQLDAVGSLIEERKYFAQGSGMMLALGVLETEYKEDMSVEEAKELARKAVQAAIKRDIGSGDGIEIVKITDKGIEREFVKVSS